MKINHIRMVSFEGARDVNLQFTAPINLVYGGNGQGKSSIRDGLTLALTGEALRVKAKGDYGLMITEGYQSAMAEVIADGEIFTAALNKAGKLTHSHKSRDSNPVLPFVLGAQRFAMLPTDDRRAFAFKVLSVAHDHATIAARMKAKGLDVGRVALVSNFLRVSFDSALTEAKRHVSEARGGWKAETGEAYGTVKAAAWRAPMPEASLVDIDATRAMLAELEEKQAAANQDSGGIAATARIVGEARVNIASLRGQAEKVGRCADKLANDQAGLVAAQQALDSATEAASSAPRVGLVHDLARELDAALLAVKQSLSPALDAYEAEYGAVATQGAGDPEAAARIPALRAALELMQRAAGNAARDHQAAMAAVAEIARLEKLVADNPVDADALAEAQQRIDGLVAERAKLVADLREAETTGAARERAEKSTEAATKHHANAVAWAAIATALEPEGIQSEILSESMKPLNARLAQSGVDTAWPVVFVRHDMAITAAGRPYELLSPSEQWRCDAMLAEAIAHLSGVKLLILDGMDVLEPAARYPLMDWLDVLEQRQELDFALVMATLKNAPTGLPESTHCHRITDGRCEALAEGLAETA